MSQTVATASLQSAAIIPDVLPESYASVSDLVRLPVRFESSDVTVSCGNTTTPTASLRTPHFSLPPGVASDGFYSILAWDPDGPSRRRPRMRCILHYMQINIPATVTDIATAGDVHAPYEPPGPPYDTGKHRYVFLLYHHNSPIDATKLPYLSSLSARGRLKPEGVERQLSEAGGGQMKLVGVNWFEAEWDEQVDKNLWARFGWMTYLIKVVVWFLK